MKLTMPFFGKKQHESSTTISKKRTKKGSDKTGGSFGSTSTSSSSDDCTSPRTVLPAVRSTSPPSSSPTAMSGNKPNPTPKPSNTAVLAAAAATTTTTVTREDLEVALRRVVETESEFAAVLAEAEAAGLSPEEALSAAAELAEADESELRDAFAVFDADGDGRISAEELQAVLASLGDEACSVEDCRRMIGGVDVDGDGFVCFDEFSNMMMMVVPPLPLQGAVVA